MEAGGPLGKVGCLRRKRYDGAMKIQQSPRKETEIGSVVTHGGRANQGNRLHASSAFPVLNVLTR
jgi:hypothetical protein